MQQYRLQIPVLFLFDPISVMDNFAFVTAKKDLYQPGIENLHSHEKCVRINFLFSGIW